MLGWLARRAPRNQRGIALRRFIGNRVIRMLVDPRAVPPQGVHQQQLRGAQVPSYTLAAELLLMHALGRDRTCAPRSCAMPSFSAARTSAGVVISLFIPKAFPSVARSLRNSPTQRHCPHRRCVGLLRSERATEGKALGMKSDITTPADVRAALKDGIAQLRGAQVRSRPKACISSSSAARV